LRTQPNFWLDLSTGRVVALPLPYLLERRHGYELDWFQRNAVTYDVLGANFTPGPAHGRTPGEDSLSAITPGAAGRSRMARPLPDARHGHEILHHDVVGRQQWMDDTTSRTCLRRGIPRRLYLVPMFSLYNWDCRLSARPSTVIDAFGV
jgi:hypothetical protein